MARFSGLLGVALGIALASGSVASIANEGFRVAGFGTVGYVADDHSRLAPMRDISQLVENTLDRSWVMDSRVGVQFEYGFPQGALIAQVVTRDQFRDSVGSAIEMAYLGISPLPELDLRLGRVNYDTFMMADIRNVGYAYPWVRPPVDFYGWIPIFSINGADIAYSLREDDAVWRVKVQKGSSRFWIPIANGEDGGYDFHSEKLASLSLSRQTPVWSFKAAYSQFTNGTEISRLAPLHQGLAQVAAMGGSVGAEAADLLRNNAFKGAKITYSTVGAAYDDGVWSVQSEIGRSTATVAMVPHGRMGYISIARRQGHWTPYAMFSAYQPENAVRAPQNDWGGDLNAALRDPAVGLADSTRIRQRTTSLGARWDVFLNTALKVQWDRTQIEPYGYGLWWGESGLLPVENRVNVFSVTVDFVF